MPLSALSLSFASVDVESLAKRCHLNWEAVGAIAELVGAGAVLVTLGYLAIQIRQHTRSVTMATFEAALNGFNETCRLYAEDPELASIALRGGADPASLDPVEAVRYQFALRHYANNVYKLMRLHQNGVYPSSEWEIVAAEAKEIFELPGPADFKRQNATYAELWGILDARESRPMIDLRIGSETEGGDPSEEAEHAL